MSLADGVASKGWNKFLLCREVHKARDRETGKLVALKKVRMENEKEGVGLLCSDLCCILYTTIDSTWVSSINWSKWAQRRCDNLQALMCLCESHMTFNKFEALIAFQSTDRCRKRTGAS